LRGLSIPWSEVNNSCRNAVLVYQYLIFPQQRAIICSSRGFLPALNNIKSHQTRHERDLLISNTHHQPSGPSTRCDSGVTPSRRHRCRSGNLVHALPSLLPACRYRSSSSLDYLPQSDTARVHSTASIPRGFPGVRQAMPGSYVARRSDRHKRSDAAKHHARVQGVYWIHSHSRPHQLRHTVHR
jgi:hypothetical protein